jgi:hypothetical protein
MLPNMAASTARHRLALVKSRLGYTVVPNCALRESPDLDVLSFAPIKGLFITWSIFHNDERQHSVGLQQVAKALEERMLHKILQLAIAASGAHRSANLSALGCPFNRS